MTPAPLAVGGHRCARLDFVGDDRRVEEERARIEAEYRRVLKSSVEFEKRIRNRWREKNREKNRRISALEREIAELKLRLEKEK